MTAEELYNLGRFGFACWREAQRLGQRDALRALNAMASTSQPGLQAPQAQVDSARLAVKALKPLRAAQPLLFEAYQLLAQADVIDEAIFARLNVSPALRTTTAFSTVFATCIGIVLAVDEITGREHGAVGGRSPSKRNAALSAELARLHEIGVTIEEVAFIFGFDPKDCRRGESGWITARGRIIRGK